MEIEKKEFDPLDIANSAKGGNKPIKRKPLTAPKDSMAPASQNADSCFTQLYQGFVKYVKMAGHFLKKWLCFCCMEKSNDEDENREILTRMLMIFSDKRMNKDQTIQSFDEQFNLLDNEMKERFKGLVEMKMMAKEHLRQDKMVLRMEQIFKSSDLYMSSYVSETIMELLTRCSNR